MADPRAAALAAIDYGYTPDNAALVDLTAEGLIETTMLGEFELTTKGRKVLKSYEGKRS